MATFVSFSFPHQIIRIGRGLADDPQCSSGQHTCGVDCHSFFRAAPAEGYMLVGLKIVGSVKYRFCVEGKGYFLGTGQISASYYRVSLYL